MSGKHCTAAELEAYVMGALDGAAAEAVENHAAGCDACAAALAGEARLEVAFEQVARHGEKREASPSLLAAARARRAAFYGAAGFVAMAAAVLLWVGAGGAAVGGVARAPAAGGTVGASVGGDPRGEGGPSLRPSGQDGAVILDARNDSLDGG